MIELKKPVQKSGEVSLSHLGVLQVKRTDIENPTNPITWGFFEY